MLPANQKASGSSLSGGGRRGLFEIGKLARLKEVGLQPGGWLESVHVLCGEDRRAQAFRRR